MTQLDKMMDFEEEKTNISDGFRRVLTHSLLIAWYNVSSLVKPKITTEDYYGSFIPKPAEHVGQ